MNKPVIIAAVLFVVFGGLTLAQNKFPVTVGVGDYGQLGYNRPDVNISAGFESQRPAYWFAVVGNFDPTGKFAYGRVTQSGVSGQLFWKPGRGIFLGDGANLRNIRFHDYGQSYWTYGPLLSGGWIQDNLHVTVTGNLPRHDIRYDFAGITWGMTYDIKRRFRVGFQEGWYKFNSKSSNAKTYNALTNNLIIGYVF